MRTISALPPATEHKLAAFAAIALPLTVAGAVCTALSSVVPALSAIIIGLVAGLCLHPLLLRSIDPERGFAPAWFPPALTKHSGTLLRTGVALLGLRFAARDLGDLGVRGLLIVTATLTITFLVTTLVARKLGNDPTGSLVIAAGFSVCGAAAASTMAGAILGRADERRREIIDEYTAATIALVSILGIVAVPIVVFAARWIGLADRDAGLWLGASLPEVAHVVMGGDLISPAALAAATIAKLTRVVLLAPLVIVVTSRLARSQHPSLGAAAGRRRAVAVPPFVIGFIACITLASVFTAPHWVVTAATWLSTAMIAGSMIAVGANIAPRSLLRLWKTTGLAALSGLGVALAVPFVLVAATR
ncbi:YeiH family protein [Rarobacter incanus]|uniref:YeiH family protein n=1 Tax=Rarobacter incanus TaxID=153494 RepID=UPI0014770DFE|nr:putative sulfate exporter family transporter [Rarobacter incanus]